MTRTVYAFGFSMFVSGLALAQLATDEVPRERTVPRAEQIRKSMQESRFRLGPIRLHPTFGLHDVGYDNNVFATQDNAVSDWRATVSAGADLILPMGRKVYLTGIVRPEYTYYQKLTDRRLLGGQYGGSLVALFNRLSIESGGFAEKSISPVSSEIEQSAPGTRRDLFARAELELLKRLSLFGSAEDQTQRFHLSESDREQGVGLEQLERDETFVRGGVRYRLRSYLDLTAATESGTTDFVSAPASNNTTRAVLLGLHYDRPRFFFNVTGGRREGEGRGAASTFPAFSTATGSYYASYQLAVPLAVDLYGHRSVVYGLYTGNPYYFENRGGLGLTLPIGQRIGLRAFSEVGSNAYPVATPGSAKRNDAATIVGGGISYRLYGNLILTVVGSQTRYDSNLDQFDRSIFRITTVVSARGDLFR